MGADATLFSDQSHDSITIGKVGGACAWLCVWCVKAGEWGLRFAAL